MWEICTETLVTQQDSAATCMKLDEAICQVCMRAEHQSLLHKCLRHWAHLVGQEPVAHVNVGQPGLMPLSVLLQALIGVRNGLCAPCWATSAPSAALPWPLSVFLASACTCNSWHPIRARYRTVQSALKCQEHPCSYQKGLQRRQGAALRHHSSPFHKTVKYGDELLCCCRCCHMLVVSVG